MRAAAGKIISVIRKLTEENGELGIKAATDRNYFLYKIRKIKKFNELSAKEFTWERAQFTLMIAL